MSRIFFVGRTKQGVLSVFQRHFPRCMGMAVSEQVLYLSTLAQIYKFINCLDPNEAYGDNDKWGYRYS